MKLLKVLGFLVIAGLVVAFLVLFLFDRSKRKVSRDSTAVSVSPTPTPVLNYFGNSEYGFILGYPESWRYPKEEKILPAQVHVYHYILDSGSLQLYVDIYKLMTPALPENFVREYFNEGEKKADWIEPVKIGNNNAARFFIPEPGLSSAGIAGTAFTKKDYALTIMTSVLEGAKEEIVADENLKLISEKFEWK